MEAERESRHPPTRLARLVMRLHRATRQPILRCRSVLATVPEAEQERYVAYLEASKGYGFRDPLEANPEYTLLFAQVREEAYTEADVYRQRHQEELRVSGYENPGFLARRGLCHVRWIAMKRLLKERHGLEWKTPAEMNPDIHFS